MALQKYSADVVIEGRQEKISEFLSKFGLKNPGGSRVYINREYGVVGFSPTFENDLIAIEYSIKDAEKLVREASKISKEIVRDRKLGIYRLIL